MQIDISAVASAHEGAPGGGQICPLASKVKHDYSYCMYCTGRGRKYRRLKYFEECVKLGGNQVKTFRNLLSL